MASKQIGQFYSGLRDRNLFDLAESDAIRRLKTETGSPSERVALSVELSRTFALHAVYLAGDEQADLWNRARDLLDRAAETLNTPATEPLRAVLLAARGELELSRAEAMAWSARLGGGVSVRIAQAAVQAAVTHLESARSATTLAVRRQLASGNAHPLSPSDVAVLNDLAETAQLRHIEARLLMARLSEGNTRIEAINYAEQTLMPLLRGVENENSIAVKLLAAESALLAGDLKLARRRLMAIEPAGLAISQQDELTLLNARLLVSENRPAEAVSFLIQYRKIRGSLPGELRLMQIEALNAAAVALDAAGSPEEARKLREQIPVVAQWTTAESGGYWGHRAQLAAQQTQRSLDFGPEVAKRLQAAKLSAEAGNVNLAIQHYESAEQLLADNRDRQALVIDLRASLLLSSGRLNDAASAFEQLSNQSPDPQRAAEAHLLSAHALGLAHDAQPTQESREAYRDRLEEQMRRFPTAATRGGAQQRLGRFYEQRRQYSQAIPLYRDMAQNGPAAAGSAAALARSYEALLRFLVEQRASATNDERATRARQLDEWTKAAQHDLQPIVENLDYSKPMLPPEEAELLFRFIRIGELVGLADDDLTDRVIDRLSDSAAQQRSESSAFWTAISEAIVPLRIASLARRGNLAAASAMVNSANLSAAALVELADTLDRLPDPEPGTVRAQELDLLRESIVDRALAQPALSKTISHKLQLLGGRIAMRQGDGTSALEFYEQAIQAADITTKTTVAEQLAEQTDPIILRFALKLWQTLEAAHAQGSADWQHARGRHISLLRRLGETAQADKLARITRLLHPDFPNDPKRRIE